MRVVGQVFGSRDMSTQETDLLIQGHSLVKTDITFVGIGLKKAFKIKSKNFF